MRCGCGLRCLIAAGSALPGAAREKSAFGTDRTRGLCGRAPRRFKSSATSWARWRVAMTPTWRTAAETTASTIAFTCWRTMTPGSIIPWMECTEFTRRYRS
uniref:Secreted protein n=1 Tax=Macrostomum lignano TaxID=282301 RepID=A0A1I8FLM5_9PLAT